MARPSLIPPNLVLPLLQKWEAGMNGEQLAAWLKETYQIETSVVTINRRIKELKEIQLQAKREQVRENASEKALDYISMMDHKILKLDKKSNILLESDDPDQIALGKALAETQLKFIDKQMNLTGMDKEEKDIDDQDAVVDNLIKKLGKSN
jgi:hypothetical protein